MCRYAPAMRSNRPSQTAMFVALQRTLAHEGFTGVPHFSDPFVGRLLSPAWALVHSVIFRRMKRFTAAHRERTLAEFDVIPLRVSVIDAELSHAVATGCRQVVILGAGLDTRAFRMPSLACADVFEVDYPSTQSYKRQRTSELDLMASRLAYVSVNLEAESVGPRLAAAGHRVDEPTAWVLEGLVMYLSDNGLRTTLADLTKRSAPGSWVLVHYTCPRKGGREQPLRRFLLSAWGEPQIGERDLETMHREVRRAGLDVESDTQPPDWARRFDARPPLGETASATHLLVARRR
jgi:methyltransferase (TIGR00027 family)